MIAIGCQDKHKTPILEIKTCPQCGEEIEVFTHYGRIIEDSVCDCGYVMKAQEPLVVKRRGQE